MPGVGATGQGMWKSVRVGTPEGPLGQMPVEGEGYKGGPGFPAGYQGGVYGYDEKTPRRGGGGGQR